MNGIKSLKKNFVTAFALCVILILLLIIAEPIFKVVVWTGHLVLRLVWLTGIQAPPQPYAGFLEIAIGLIILNFAGMVINSSILQRFKKLPLVGSLVGSSDKFNKFMEMPKCSCMIYFGIPEPNIILQGYVYGEEMVTSMGTFVQVYVPSTPVSATGHWFLMNKKQVVYLQGNGLERRYEISNSEWANTISLWGIPLNHDKVMGALEHFHALRINK